MAKRYEERLNALKKRRTPSSAVVAKSYSSNGLTQDTLFKLSLPEEYETKGNGTATRYALGCMAEMKPELTKISLRDGERVSEQLKNGLSIGVETRLQGSVPLNIHIRASSDVDLLVLATSFCTFDTPTVSTSSYSVDPSIIPALRLLTLRSECETLLQKRYPAADVDTSGAKAIAISGGSLARKVDVVPSHWHDNRDYQRTYQEYLRGVKILDKNSLMTYGNLPFLHIQKINEKDANVGGNAKRAIRLLKSISRDSDYEVKLTSFDIAGLIYHMEANALIVPWYQPLQLITKVEQFLWRLWSNQEYAQSLYTPDCTRKIIDTADKMKSVSFLWLDLRELIASIGTEYVSELPYYSDSVLANERATRALNEAIIL